MVLWIAAAFGGSEVVSASYVVKVASKEEAAAAIIEQAQSLDGWFGSLTDDAVSLRVPAADVDTLMAFVEQQGLVADRSFDTVDRGRELAEIDARLQARQELLTQYLDLLSEASPSAVLQLEVEITRLIAQIESLKGRRRKIVADAQHATVFVSFRFRDRRRRGRDQVSDFDWLNTLGVDWVMGQMRTGDRFRGPRVGTEAALPEGMSAYLLRKEHRASSPDGVVFRQRSVKHDPSADLAFWQEAVTEHLVINGYRVLDTEELSPQAFWLEAAVPMGEQDISYAIGLRLDGSRLHLVEATGEMTRYDARREAVRDAGARALR